jgi:hypothetical protein
LAAEEGGVGWVLVRSFVLSAFGAAAFITVLLVSVSFDFLFLFTTIVPVVAGISLHFFP